MPIRLDCDYGWYVVMHQSDWEGMGDKQKYAVVAQVLCAIPTGDDNEGKVSPPDYKDYGIILRTLGVDFLENPEIPDILSEDVKWIS